MLLATAKAWFPRRGSPYSKELVSGIASLVNEVQKFSIRRNNAMHAPINLLMDTSTFEFKLEPNYWYGNPNAKQLQGKDVLSEFRWYVAQTESLRNYAQSINTHLISGRLPLPSKPILPLLSQFQNQTPVRRKTTPK
jgi:hypothetical protein